MIVSFFFSIVTPRPVGLHTGILESVASQNHPIFVLNAVQIKAWNPLKDTLTTQPRSSQNRKGRFANTAFLVGEWNRNRFLVIILFWLILFVSRFSRFCIFPLRHLFGSCILPDPASYRTRRLSGSYVLPDPASYRTRHLSGSYVLPDPASLLLCCDVASLRCCIASMLQCCAASSLRCYAVLCSCLYCFSVLSLWTFGLLGLWAFGLLDLRAFEPLSLWAFGPLSLWAFELLGLWTFGLLGRPIPFEPSTN